MKKTRKLKNTLVSLMLIILTIFSLTSCKLLHKHTWKDYLVKAPTCTEIGILKSLCIECGKAEYSEISKAEHNYVNGVCTVCNGLNNSKNGLTAVPMPTNANNQGKWSFPKIHEKVCSTMNTNVSYSAFMNSLSGASLKNASINLFGSLSLTVTYPLKNGGIFEMPVVLSIDNVSPTNPSESIGYLLRADIKNSELYMTYTTGLEMYAGKISGNGENAISGFGVNSQKELVIYYSNNTIAYGGKFAS